MIDSDSKPRAAPKALDGAAPRRRARWPWIAALIALIVVGAAAGWRAYGPAWTGATPSADKAADASSGKAGKGVGGRPGQDRPVPVLAALVRKAPIELRIAALGTVVPRNSVVVRTRVDGPLLRVLFREGEIVKAGQLLAEIDPEPTRAALEQASGQLARDEALLANAKVDLERYQGLAATESIPRQQVDTQQATVKQYQGIVQADRGQVDAARLQLGYTRIVAPIAGQLGLRLVDPGNIVRAGDANGLVSITQIDPITVVASIPENQVAVLRHRMREKAPVPVEAWDSTLKTRLATGQLISTDNQIDTSTGTLRLKAEFRNADGALFPNQFVNVRVLVGLEEASIVVPQAAVQRGAQGPYVYAVNADGTVSLRSVTLGTTDGERIALKSGVDAGMRVVVDGADRLRDGARVEVIDRFAAPSGARGGGDGRRQRAEGKGGEGKGGEGKGGEGKGGEGKGGEGKGGEGKGGEGKGGEGKGAGTRGSDARP